MGARQFSEAETIILRRGTTTFAGQELILSDCKKKARTRHKDWVKDVETWTFGDGSSIVFRRGNIELGG